MSTTAEHPDPGRRPEASPDAFRMLAESAPIGMAHADASGTLLFVNERWRAITGITDPTPIPSRVLRDLVHPEDLPGVVAAYTRATRDITDVSVELRLVRGDGALRYVRINSTPVVAGDTLTGFAGTTLDITEFIEASQARRRSEERYRDLVAKAPLGQAVYALDGVLLEVNRAWGRLLGYEPADVVGRPAAEFVHPDDRVDLEEPVRQLLAGEVDSFERERRLIHHDGHVVWVSSSIAVERDASGAPRSFHSVVFDISGRKAAEDALRTSEARYRRLIDRAPVGQLISRIDGELVEVNEAFLDMMGATAEELFAREPTALLHPDDWPLYRREVRRLLAGELDSIDHERRLMRPDGGLVWVSGGTSLLREGDEVFLHSVMHDVTERKEALARLRASEERFRTLTESIPVGVYQADTDGRVVYVNPQWRIITGGAPDPATYEDAMAPVHPDDLERVTIGLARVLHRGGHYRDEYRIVSPDGSVRWLSNRGTATVDATGAVTGIIGSLEDITALIQAQEQNARLADIIESTSDLVAITDVTTGRLVYLNRAAREVFGLVDRELSEVVSFNLYSPEATPIYRRAILPALTEGETWSGELPMVDAEGDEIMVWQTISPTLLADGSLHQVSLVGRDVTERRRLEADLAHQATHDALTGLPNRVLLLDHLELAIARAERDKRLIALLFLDLDRFKQVNDTLGHDAGDELLAQAARLISGVVRPSDTVARLGGDEFVVLCDDVEDEEHAISVAQRVASAIEARPFNVKGHEVPISASIGIALTAGGQVHPEAVLRDADAAMYRAKDLGRARLEVYDESMRRRTAHRLELSEQLAGSIEAGDIQVRFQPGVDLLDGRVTCVEALARWHHPTRGLLSPHEFIALAEETGLIVGLGLRVLSIACEHGRRWEHAFGDAAPRVHVNLSARQLITSNLPVLVQGVLDGSGLSPHKLCLEITESVLMDDASGMIDTLCALKETGIALAIDDFGTGYSSLSYLRRFPVDVLKVDQSFVAGLGPDPEDSTIVAAIVNLAATLDLVAVAEGVETSDQIARLRALGCRQAQGYYFAQPVLPEEVAGMIERGFPDLIG